MELLFLYLPTLKEKMSNWSQPNANEKDNSSDTNLVLLGVLALMACFYTDLV